MINLETLRHEIHELYKKGDVNNALQKQAELFQQQHYQPKQNDYKFYGLLHFAKGDYGKSAEVMAQGAQLWPHEKEFPLNVAVNYSRDKQYEEAIKWSEKTLQLDSNNAVIYDVLAKCYGAKHDLKKAQQAGEKALTLKDQAACQITQSQQINAAPPPV